MFISIQEIIDIIIMTFAIGYIFSDVFKKQPTGSYDPLEYYKNPLLENIKSGAIIAAPAIVLHELAHKFSAIAFGAIATLHAPYFWYILIILLKLMRFPILFFVGGYVSHTPLPPLESAIVAIAGPLVNLLLWIFSLMVIKHNLINKKYYHIIIPFSRLNMLLFIFNMLPFPGFDGYHFISGVLNYII